MSFFTPRKFLKSLGNYNPYHLLSSSILYFTLSKKITDHTSSQLGHGFNLTTSTSGESQLQLYPTPRQVDLSSSSSNDQDRSESQSIRILKIVTGLDHTLLLIRRLGQETNEILVCGR